MDTEINSEIIAVRAYPSQLEKANHSCHSSSSLWSCKRSCLGIFTCFVILQYTKTPYVKMTRAIVKVTWCNKLIMSWAAIKLGLNSTQMRNTKFTMEAYQKKAADTITGTNRDLVTFIRASIRRALRLNTTRTDATSINAKSKIEIGSKAYTLFQTVKALTYYSKMLKSASRQFSFILSLPCFCFKPE